MTLAFAGDYRPNGRCPYTDPDSDIVLVANLECALGGDGSISRKAYSISAGTEALAGLDQSPIRAVNLANNHVYDSGEQAFSKLIRLLDENSLVACYGLRDRPFAELQIDSKRCAVIGCLEPCRSRGRLLFREENVSRLVAEIRPRFDRVFITPHWGKESEFAHYPSPKQQRLARSWIDAGADGVFGHHPHTIHGAEWYKSRPIFYSLGNFLFESEENQRYPLASFGLCVFWKPGDGSMPDRYEAKFVTTSGSSVAMIAADRAEELQRFLTSLSNDLAQSSGATASYLRWARRVGPTYIEKSMKSWRRRLRTHFLHTAPLGLAWLLHPMTLLLALGSAFPDEPFRRRLTRLQTDSSGEKPRGYSDA